MNYVVVSLGVLLAALAMLGIVAAAWARHEIKRVRNEVSQALIAFVSAPEPGKPSPLAEITEVIAARFAHQTISQMRAQLMTDIGHEKRQETALMQDAMVDAATQQSPLLGLLAGAFPSVTKRLAKNPTALPALLNLLSKGGGGIQLPLREGSNGGARSVADRLKAKG